MSLSTISKNGIPRIGLWICCVDVKVNFENKLIKLMEDYQIQMLTAFFAFLGGWGLSLVNDRRHKLQQIKDACNSLRQELTEVKKDLDKRTTKIFTIDDNGTAHTHSIMIAVSRFESLIYSGVFRQLDYDVQNKTAEIYNKIKHVNHASYRLLEILTDQIVVNNDFVDNMKSFGDNIEKQIDDIKNEIPNLIKLIEERMPKALL